VTVILEGDRTALLLLVEGLEVSVALSFNIFVVTRCRAARRAGSRRDCTLVGGRGLCAWNVEHVDGMDRCAS